jgi:hypothetical protein
MLNYEQLCDIHILLGFACIWPLLEFVHVLIKFAQSRDVFVCDLVVPIKDCQGDVYNMYCDSTFKFTINSFWVFKSLLELKHEIIHMCCIVDAKSRIPHLAFKLNGQHVWAIHWDLETMVPSMVTKGVLIVVESLVKNQCKGKLCNFLPFILLPLNVFFKYFFSLSCKQ